MIADWAECMAGLSDEDIKLGLASLPKSWPPSVDEFVELCRGKSIAFEHGSPAYRAADNSLALEKKADKAVAKQAVEGFRSILFGKTGARERARRVEDAERMLFGNG